MTSTSDHRAANAFKAICEYSRVMTRVAISLTPGDLDKIKFACILDNSISQSRADKIKTSCDLLLTLQKYKLINDGSLCYLSQLLALIDRYDLQKQVDLYRPRRKKRTRKPEYHVVTSESDTSSMLSERTQFLSEASNNRTNLDRFSLDDDLDDRRRPHSRESGHYSQRTTQDPTTTTTTTTTTSSRGRRHERCRVVEEVAYWLSIGMLRSHTIIS